MKSKYLENKKHQKAATHSFQHPYEKSCFIKSEAREYVDE